jgi:hypothetical protein
MKQARKELMLIQLELGHLITPYFSMLLNNEWEEVVAKDPSGVQALNWAKDLRERLTPMAS